MKTKSLLILCVLFVSTVIHGATYTVINTDESGEGSLAWAFESVTAADDVIAFNVDATEFLLPAAINKAMVIDGLNQFNSQKIIFKKSAGNKFADLAGITLTLKNIVFDGENLSGAIGITADNASTLNLENCIIKNINSSGAANNGGAARIQGVANITNCLFENNTQGSGTYGGGAICMYNSANITIEQSSFIGNKALAGGAIMGNGTVATGYTLKVYNSTFANNEASLGSTNRRGGAVYLACPTSTEVNSTFINCTFTGNSAINNGGGICAFASASKKINVNLINSIVTNNMSGGNKYSDIDVWNLNDRVYFPNATNCIYGSLLGTATGISWTNSINPTDINEANIFMQTEEWVTGYERPVITDSNSQKVIRITHNSIAKNAGVATLTGFTIPTVDQLGTTRPATPAIGAVEYDFTSNIIPNQDEQSVNIKMENSTVSFSGLSGEQQINVYGLTGNLLHKGLINNNENLSLGHLNANLVVVRVQDKSFKVLLK